MRKTCHQDQMLAPYTTLALGGPARYLCPCEDLESARSIAEQARADGLPLHVLGGGSNTVFLDSGFDGVVLHVRLKGVEVMPDGGHALVRAAAGEDWDALVVRTVQEGLAGIECLSGIPGYVGATPIQNVGAYGQEVGQSVAQVEAIDLKTLETVSFAPSDCLFGYRTSRFKMRDMARYLITSVTFRLRRGVPDAPRYPELEREVGSLGIARMAPPEALAAMRDAVLGLRRRKSMVLDPEDPNTRSVGSFFTNPVLTKTEAGPFLENVRARFGDGAEPPLYPSDGGYKVPAAWLIERAGFERGYRRGGAAISERHTLALVNRGTTARELLSLAEEIEDRVREIFAVTLRREPVVVGEPSRG